MVKFTYLNYRNFVCHNHDFKPYSFCIEVCFVLCSMLKNLSCDLLPDLPRLSYQFAYLLSIVILFLLLFVDIKICYENVVVKPAPFDFVMYSIAAPHAKIHILELQFKR